MSSLVSFRSAEAGDAEQVALLHADSWRRHYRGAYADSFLDGDVEADRRSLWAGRLAARGRSETVLAEYEDRLVGFVHVAFDADPGWGSLVDNLHVRHGHQRMGIGIQLLVLGAQAVVERATGEGMYLWVLERNVAAQRFYRASGATCVETASVPPPGGDPTRLSGDPQCLRMAWPDASQVGPRGAVHGSEE